MKKLTAYHSQSCNLLLEDFILKNADIFQSTQGQWGQNQEYCL